MGVVSHRPTPTTGAETACTRRCGTRAFCAAHSASRHPDAASAHRGGSRVVDAGRGRADQGAADEAAELDAYDELQDGTGGELGFPAARKAPSIGTAYVGLGMGDDAEPAAGQALELYLAADPEDRSVGGIAGARIDLATARLLKSRPDLAGAADALNPVMELPSEHRGQRLRKRLDVLSGLLAQSRLRDAVEARNIGQQIEAFSTLSASSGPAALTAGG